MNNIKIETQTAMAFHIKIGVMAFLKMFLRGIFDLSFMVKLQGIMPQVPIGKRAGVEMENGDRIIAVRISANTAEIISAYNKYRGDEPISKRIEILINGLFKMIHFNELTAKKISTVRK